MPKKFAVSVFALALVAVLFVNLAGAAPTGIENITLAKNSSTVHSGANLSIGYNVKLTSGTYSFGTTVSISNSVGLSKKNITVLLTGETSGNPPFNGTMRVFLGAVNPGQYLINMTGTSSQGTLVGPATFTLNVASMTTTSASSTSTPPTTSVIASSSTSSPTSSTIALGNTTSTSTVQRATTSIGSGLGSPAAGQNPLPPIYVIVAIIVIVIIVMAMFMMKNAPKVEKRRAAR